MPHIEDVSWFLVLGAWLKQGVELSEDTAEGKVIGDALATCLAEFIALLGW
jgi:hypothetical protein